MINRPWYYPRLAFFLLEFFLVISAGFAWWFFFQSPDFQRHQFELFSDDPNNSHLGIIDSANPMVAYENCMSIAAWHRLTYPQGPGLHCRKL